MTVTRSSLKKKVTAFLSSQLTSKSKIISNQKKVLIFNLTLF